MAKLVPPDMKRCQALISNGHSFMTFGGVPGYVQCPNCPMVIVKERKAGADGSKGSMSLCDGCLRVAVKQLGATHFTIAVIKKKVKV